MDKTGIVMLAAVYFLPAMIAVMRHHSCAGGVLMLNLVLGWTLPGWVVSFVWACSNAWRQPVAISRLPGGRPPGQDAGRSFEDRGGRVIACIIGALVLLIVAGLVVK